ncbi:hypothetical protein NQZ68_019138 [Dissostichus eleginoides]|nr:hypothetical protein NQZ68_019138 [Dissostichus eleginoides]
MSFPAAHTHNCLKGGSRHTAEWDGGNSITRARNEAVSRSVRGSAEMREAGRAEHHRRAPGSSRCYGNNTACALLSAAVNQPSGSMVGKRSSRPNDTWDHVELTCFRLA